MAFRFLILLLILPAFCLAEELTLEQAIYNTLQLQADINISKLSYDTSQSTYKGTSGPFDNTLSASGQLSSDQTPLSSTEQESAGIDIFEADKQTYSVTHSKLFRSGIELQTSANIETATNQSLDTPDEASSSIGATISFPIYDFLLENQNTTNERIALEGTNASLQDYYTQISTSIYQTVVSYWNYLAAYEKLILYKESVENTEQMLKDFQKLIDSGERPKADANQIKANLAVKQGRVINGKKDLDALGNQLSNAMGIPFSTAPLPPPKVRWVDVEEPVEAILEQLVLTAQSQRFSIKALESNIRSARLLRDSSRRGVKPDLDLFVAASLSDKGRNVSTDVFDNAETLSAGVIFSMPLENNAAESALTSNEIALRQLAINLADTKRQVSIEVATALNNLRQSLKAYEYSLETVALYEESLRVEVQKLKLGMSTVIDVINTHENLQSALISKVEDLRLVAVALADVINNIGGIISTDGEQVTVNISSLYSMDLQSTN